MATTGLDNGVINKPSNHSVDEIVEKLEGHSGKRRPSPCSRWWIIVGKRPKLGCGCRLRNC